MLSATIRPSSVLNSIFPLIWAESPLNAYVPQRYPPIGRVPHFNSKSVEAQVKTLDLFHKLLRTALQCIFYVLFPAFVDGLIYIANIMF